MLHSAPTGASLDDPLYYLANGRSVIRWVLEQHADLLLAAERSRLQGFLALPDGAQALLLRLIMRTHDSFRLDSLHYPELPQPLPVALDCLLQGDWLVADPPLTVPDLARLLRRQEWRSLLQDRGEAATLPTTASKSRMVSALAATAGATQQPISNWWPQWPGKIVAVAEAALFERVRLMFFGNLHQDWSEFVITELGHQRYEPVPLDRASRAFQSREEVNLYLALHACRQALAAEDADLQALWQLLADCGSAGNSWLAHRRARVVHALGHQAERAGEIELALQAYADAWLPESRVRYFRVREKTHPPAELWPELLAAQQQAVSMEETVSLQRILGRLARKLGTAPPATALQAPVTEQICLAAPPALNVELAVAGLLSDDGHQCHYVENRLFTGLLALLCWPALYAPIAGAFFHPFQAGPADLFREGFARRREAMLEAQLARLEDGSHVDTIMTTWRSRQGTACPLVAWPVLTEPLLEQALACIPAQDLQAICRHLLKDLQRHKRGLPDLIRFDRQSHSYELIEVKGPGDRLQDSQRQWLQFFGEQGIPARVLHVSWPTGAST